MHPLLFCTPIGAAYVWSQALSSLIPKASPEAEHIRGVGLTADCSNADLRGADLSGADLEGAIFDFTTQVNTRTSFYQARNLDKTGKDGDFGLDKACGFTPALNNAEYNPKGARNEDKHTAEVVSLADRRGGRGK